MTADIDTQRITQLTPLADVLARVDALVRPVAPRNMALRSVAGRVLAEDVAAKTGLPAAARALRDGYAVASDATMDASSYAPAPLAAPPVRVDVGDALPPGADAVAPLDVIVSRNGRHEAVAAVVPGEGVLAVNADVRPGEILRTAGARLRQVDVAVLAAVGIRRVVVREPRLRLVTARAGRDSMLEAARTLIAQAVAAEGGVATSQRSGRLAAELNDSAADAVVVIGGTGSGRGDASVSTLARVGRVEVHGIALSPGETAAFGFAGPRPVLLLPGRIDAALAVWLTLGRHLMARLCAAATEAPTWTATLTRKIASALGQAEVVPVRCRGGKAEPIASGYVPLQALAHADGWILVPADSEGYPAGAEVVVRPWL